MTPLSASDLEMFHAGTEMRAFEHLGAHPIDGGTRFAVWAPNAELVSVVGDWDGWRGVPLSRSAHGVWEGFVPGVRDGARYKYRVVGKGGQLADKADPFGFAHDLPPSNASVVTDLAHAWDDATWMAARRSTLSAPMSIYEVHLGSWRRVPEEDHRSLTYRELAPRLASHVRELGFTHVQLLPVMEHPFGGSFGYQITGYFAPTSRHGSPADLMFLIDHLHQKGIGVILDWAPSYFATDAHGLARFDGTTCYEHDDGRLHPGSGGLLFDLSRPEVQSFILSSATFWLERFHADALRVTGVSSMLPSSEERSGARVLSARASEAERRAGQQRDHERSAAGLSFVRQLNDAIRSAHPDVSTIAEESTSWPMVSRPTNVGGLGFGMKCDTGWMHDMLRYLERDPTNRRFHHNEITFRSLYASHETFVLPLSHDEVHGGKGSLLNRMPGDRWRKFANLRLLYAMMYSQPGKKLLFMGSELAQWREWSHDTSLDWHLLDEPPHVAVHDLVVDLNRLYREEPALHVKDEEGGFAWIDANDAERSVLSFLRVGEPGDRPILAVLSFTPSVRYDYRVGVPIPGEWEEILNTDAEAYGGSGVGNLGRVVAAETPAHGLPCSVSLTLPPLAAVWFRGPEGWSGS